MIKDSGIGKPDLSEIEPESIAEWLACHYNMTTEDFLDTFCDDLEEARDILLYDAETYYEDSYDEE